MAELKTLWEIPGLGYVKYIDHMGSDATFVEAARMSTGKGFYGWYWEEDAYSDCMCTACRTHHLAETLSVVDVGEAGEEPVCFNCWKTEIQPIGDMAEKMGKPRLEEPKLLGKKGAPRDFGLLNTLYSNGHSTPFEMGEIAIEVMAPIFVVREWQRHRTQNYNEFSARFSQMPNAHYIPSPERVQKQSKSNKQGSGEVFPPEEAKGFIGSIASEQEDLYRHYNFYLEKGVAKELARINTPVSRMTKMRAKSDVRNWLGFLRLRMETNAQWEIRQYANAMASLIKQLFPHTFELFLEYDLLGVRYSGKEQRFIATLLTNVLSSMDPQEKGAMSQVALAVAEMVGLSVKQVDNLLTKLQTDRTELFKDVLKNL
jgi:thymidylate synthase (FAD)